MGCTDRHYRLFLRLISKRVTLFSEMVTANAVIYGDRDKLIGYGMSEHPLVLQLCGSDPAAMAKRPVECSRNRSKPYEGTATTIKAAVAMVNGKDAPTASPEEKQFSRLIDAWSRTGCAVKTQFL